MKKAILVVLVLLNSLLIGCSVVKTPEISAVNQEEGLLNLSYRYRSYQVPKVNVDEAQGKASVQCSRWGFLAGTQNEGQSTTCVEYTQNQQSCLENEVSIRFKCGLSLEQKAAKETKRQEQLKQEAARQEQANKEAAARSANNRKENVDKTSWCASSTLAMSVLMGKLGEQDLKSKFEGYSLVMAKTSMELGSNIGLTNKELVAINQKNTKLVANGMRGKTAVGMNDYLNENVHICTNLIKADDEVHTLFQKYTNQ